MALNVAMDVVMGVVKGVLYFNSSWCGNLVVAVASCQIGLGLTLAPQKILSTDAFSILPLHMTLSQPIKTESSPFFADKVKRGVGAA